VIGDQVAVDDVGEVPLQAPGGLLGGLGLGQLSSVIDLARTGVADLADSDEVGGMP
jgi:hypothetical protein